MRVVKHGYRLPFQTDKGGRHIHPPLVGQPHFHASIHSKIGARPDSGGGGQEYVDERCHRGSELPLSRLLFQTVPRRESYGGLETSDKSVPSEQVFVPIQVQDGNCGLRPSVDSRRGLHGLYRSAGCLFPGPSAPLLQEIPQICSQRQSFSVHMPLFRPCYSAPGFYSNFFNCFGMGSFSRDTTNQVPRRLAYPCSIARGMPESRDRCPELCPEPGSGSEPPKIRFGSIPEGHLPGYNLGFCVDESLPFTDKDSEPSPNYRLLSGLSKPTSTKLDDSTRPSGILRETSPQQSNSHEVSSMATKESRLPVERKLIQDGSIVGSSEIRSDVVEEPGELDSRGSPRTSSPRVTVVHGCIQRGMGSSRSNSPSVRDLGVGRESSSYQRSRDEDSSSGNPRVSGDFDGSLSRDNVGQLISSDIHKQTRGNQVKGTMQSGTNDPVINRKSFNPCESKVHSGKEKCPSRPAESRESNNWNGVVPPPTSGKSSSGGMGISVSGPVRHKTKQETSGLLLPSTRSRSSSGGRLPSKLGSLGCLRFPSVRPSAEGHKQSQGHRLSRPHSSCSIVAKRNLVSRPSGSSRSNSSRSTSVARHLNSTSFRSSSHKCSSPPPSRLEVVVSLLRKEGFSRETAEVMSRTVRSSSAKLYQGKWTVFCNWCSERDINPVKASLPNIADFLLYLRTEKELSLSAVKGYRSALNHIFSLKGLNLAASPALSMLFKSFSKSCPPKEVCPPAWDVSLVLRSLSKPPYEPLEKASIRDLTLKTVFLLALASAKRVGELHALSFRVSHTAGWKSISFSFLPDFVAKNQDPSKYDERFSSFSVPSLDDFVGSDPEELLLCPVRAMKTYLSRTQAFRPQLKSLFISTLKKPKVVAKNTISFWLREVIRRAYQSNNSIEIPKSIRIHEIRAIAPSLLFDRNFEISQVLKAGVWKRQTTFTSFYLREISHQYLDSYSLGPIVAAQEVVHTSSRPT